MIMLPDESVGGTSSSGGAEGDSSNTSGGVPKSSHVYKLKSNYLGLVGGGEKHHEFKITLTGTRRATNGARAVDLYAQGNDTRVQIGLLFKEV